LGGVKDWTLELFIIVIVSVPVSMHSTWNLCHGVLKIYKFYFGKTTYINDRQRQVILFSAICNENDIKNFSFHSSKRKSCDFGVKNVSRFFGISHLVGLFLSSKKFPIYLDWLLLIAHYLPRSLLWLAPD
jgi:hypothetical protein